MLSDDELKKFRDLLADQHDWPSDYLFKFIVPVEKMDEVAALFPSEKMEQKASRLGNYVSLSLTILVDSPDVVVAVYQQASRIKGLIAL